MKTTQIRTLALSALTFGFLGSACTPKEQTPAATADEAEEVEPVEAEVAETTWADLDQEQRKKHMKEVVAPKMGEVFKEADAERYATIKCSLCHGPAASEGKFDMPNPDLPALNPANSFEAHMGEKAEITKFMMKRVVPTMAGLLDQQPYDPATQEGFGCFGCHTMKK